MKIEPGNEEYFLIDGIPHQRGRYDLFINTNKVGLMRQNGEFLQNKEQQVIDDFGNFTNGSSAAFASVDAFVAYVKTFIFIKGAI